MNEYMLVLSDNPLSVAEDELKDLEVLLTMIGGVIGYSAPGNDLIIPDSPPQKRFFETDSLCCSSEDLTHQLRSFLG